jgi:hypothetical protein
LVSTASAPEPAPRRPPDRAARRIAWALALITLVAVPGAWYLGRSSVSVQRDDPAETTTPITVPVDSATLRDVVTVRGTPATDTARAVRVAGTGRVTVAAQPGTPVEAGTVLLEIDGQPVVVLPGTRPMWRPLTVGTVGEDVAQLEAALHELGFDPGTVDRTATARTLAAWRALRTQAGYPGAATEVPLGAVAFLDLEPGTTVATADAHTGDLVTDGTTVAGLRAGAAPIRVPLSTQATKGLTAGAVAVVRDESSGAEHAARVTEIVTGDDGGRAALVQLDDPTAAVPDTVLVDLVLAESPAESLVVPLTAIRTSSDGRTQVERLDASGTPVPIPVDVGLVTDGRAAITGPLAAGDQVVVTAPTGGAG